MKILFLSTKSPFPENDGHSLRTSGFLKAMAREHEVYLLSFVKHNVEYQYSHFFDNLVNSYDLVPLKENHSKVFGLLSLFISILKAQPFVVYKYSTRLFSRKIESLLDSVDFDCIYLDILPMTVYNKLFIGRKVVLNEHNFESNILKRIIENSDSWVTRLFYTIQYKWLFKYEVSVLRSVSRIIACSDNDKKEISNYVSSDKIDVIPNGVDIDFFKKDKEINPDSDRSEMLFIGGFDWFPNKDGVLWFCKEILPEIVSQCHDSRLNIIGKGAEDIAKHADGKVVCHGFVDDVRSFMEPGAIFVVPLRIGGGTRLKILNAMAMGMCVVTTSIGAEGLDVEDGKNCFVEDDPMQFAQKIVEIIHGNIDIAEVSHNAEQLIADKYAWEVLGKSINNSLI